MAVSNKSRHSTIELVSIQSKVPKNIFVDIQSDSSGTTPAMLAHLQYLHRAILDPRKFEKEMNKEIAQSKKELIKLKKTDKQKITDEEQIIEKNKKLSILEQEKANCLYLAIEFRKEIESLKSPQDVDAYIETINQIYIHDLLGRSEDENNPIIAENYSDIFKRALKQFRKTKKNKKDKLFKSEKDALFKDIPLLSLDKTEPITDWENAQSIIDPLKQAINSANKKAKSLLETCINEISKGDPDRAAIIRKKYEILDSMRNYAETSKLNFNRTYKFSSTFYAMSSVFSILSNTALLARAIPGANLIADGVSKTLGFLSYAFLTAGQAADPNVARTDKLAAKRHFEAMKKYNITETTLASIGTLSLAIGIGTALAGAAPILAPILFVAGGLTLTVSNIISAERYRKEIKWLTSELNKKYEDLIENKDKILSKNLNDLKTDREKAFYRDAKKIEALKRSYRGKIADSIGTTLATVAAVGLLLTIAFPPAGLVLTGTVFTALTVGTIAVSLYSLYQGYREREYQKQFRDAEDAIEKDNINIALKNGNRQKLAQRLNPEGRIEMQETQEIPPTLPYTPSFSATHPPSDSDNEIESKKEKDQSPSKP